MALELNTEVKFTNQAMELGSLDLAVWGPGKTTDIQTLLTWMAARCCWLEDQMRLAQQKLDSPLVSTVGFTLDQIAKAVCDEQARRMNE